MITKERKEQIDQNYVLIKNFEKKKLGTSFYEVLDAGFSSIENRPLYPIIEYVDHDIIPFLRDKEALSDLAIMSAVKRDISIGLYSIIVAISYLEKEDPREIRNDLFKSYLALKEFVEKPIIEIKKMLISPLLRSSQIDFINQFYADEKVLTEENCSYEVIREPFFHFKYKDF